jgi:hypothetical protein
MTYGRTWTEDEIRRLKLLAGEGISAQAIARLLKRSIPSIKQKATELKLSLIRRPKAKKTESEDAKEPGRLSARSWTEVEDAELRALALTDASTREIGIRMNRTATAIRIRARKLHVILGRRG